jgi:hypothetical protein
MPRCTGPNASTCSGKAAWRREWQVLQATITGRPWWSRRADFKPVNAAG